MKKGCFLMLLALACFAPALFSQNRDHSLNYGFSASASVVRFDADGACWFAGVGVPIPGGIYMDTVFVAKIAPSGALVWRKILTVPYEEVHYIYDLQPTPDGGCVVSFESTLCDVAGYIPVMQKLSAAGDLVWEKIGGWSGSDLVFERFEPAPDGNLIGFSGQKIAKISQATGDVLWQTSLSSTQYFYRFALLPGTEDFWTISGNAIWLFRQQSPSAGPPYQSAGTVQMPANIYATELEMAPDGSVYTLAYNGKLFRADPTTMQLETLPTQPETVVSFAAQADGLYFVAHDNGVNTLYKTDLAGGQPQQLPAPQRGLFPQKITARGGRVAICGSDLSGKDTLFYTQSGVFGKYASQAWARILNQPTEPTENTLDVGILEIEQREPLLVETVPGWPAGASFYNFSGGDFRLKIANHGSEPVGHFYANIAFQSNAFWGICSNVPARSLRFDGVLQPGASVWMDFGDVAANGQWEFPTEFCFWTSGPNDQPDAQKSNDAHCKQVFVGTSQPLNAGFRAWPNPIGGGQALHIESPTDFRPGARWRLVNLMGQTVGEGECPAGARAFGAIFPKVPNGTYWLVLGEHRVCLVAME